MERVKLGVIGGSGLYEMQGLEELERVSVSTPFGAPSDDILVGILQGRRIAFLPRHGVGHRIMPTELPVRANIYALKSLGVERIISVSACGSMKEEIEPLDIVIPDQIYDNTKARPKTFFGQGLVIHVGLAEPFCPILSGALYRAALEVGAIVHKGGTFICIEGPQFSTRAESRIYRQWGVDIIGMTVVPEAKLAREAEICYVTIAMVTDYDVWHEVEEAVTVEMVRRNLLRNVETAQNILRAVVPMISEGRDCACGHALRDAIITQRERIPAKAKDELSLLIGKYLEEQ